MWGVEGRRRKTKAADASVGESALQASHRGQEELKGRADIRDCQEGTLGTQGGGKDVIEKIPLP